MHKMVEITEREEGAQVGMKCPLCSQLVSHQMRDLTNSELYHCRNCELIFKNPKVHPSQSEEAERYLEHNNDESSKGYVDFLNKAVKPTRNFMEPGMEGLDYGCGPNPVLSQIITEAGFTCANYDPIFFPELPDERMDFIFATECFEHFFDSIKEMRLITALLRPGGILTIMTNRWRELDKVADWWYVRDKTHVVFYHQKSFEYICKTFGYSVLFDDGESVLVLQKDVVANR